MSNFTCLTGARQWLGKTIGKDFAKEGVSGSIPVLTATPNYFALKSLSLLVIISNNVNIIKVLDGNREAVDIGDLENKNGSIKWIALYFNCQWRNCKHC